MCFFQFLSRFFYEIHEKYVEYVYDKVGNMFLVMMGSVRWIDGNFF
jgi:hypothetical protein